MKLSSELEWMTQITWGSVLDEVFLETQIQNLSFILKGPSFPIQVPSQTPPLKIATF